MYRTITIDPTAALHGICSTEDQWSTEQQKLSYGKWNEKKLKTAGILIVWEAFYSTGVQDIQYKQPYGSVSTKA